MKNLVLLLSLLVALVATGYGQTTIDYLDTENRTAPIDLAGEDVYLSIASGTATQSGKITGEGRVSKIGEGTLVFAFHSTYASPLSINGGILQLGDATHSASVQLSAHLMGDGQTAASINSSGTLNNGALGSIRGGHAGSFTGGNGGHGVIVQGGALNNLGSINGGSGLGGNGGTGVIVLSGDSFHNTGTVIGGNTIASNAVAGVGAIVSAGTTFSNSGTIKGGSGPSEGNYVVAGGAGLMLASLEDVTLGGSIIGGDGSVMTLGLVIRGGIGAEVSLSSGKKLTNHATVTGGHGGLGLKIHSAAEVLNQGAITGGIEAFGIVNFVNEAAITGYTGLNGDSGGVGANLTLTGGATFSETSVITGGVGSSNLTQGAGGVGLMITAQDDVTNFGQITGGSGGVIDGLTGAGGIGAEVTLSSTADFINYGAILAHNEVGLKVHSAREVLNHGVIGAAQVTSTERLVNHGEIGFLTAASTPISLTNTGTIWFVYLSNAANTVTLQTGSKITLSLNVGTNVNSTLILDGIGSQYYSAAVGATTFAGSLVKEGTGTWILDHAFNYTGSTTVGAGTLLLDSSITSDVTVKSGATFGGDGITSGDITLETGSKLSPTGSLQANSLTWHSGAALLFSLGTDGTSDLLDLSGDLLMDGSGIFAFTFDDAGWEIGETYTLIRFDGITTFDAGDLSFTNGGNFAGNFAIEGNTVQFTLAIPEPGSSLLILTALLTSFLALSYRNRRCDKQ
jgi:autotransporter-associated beta strand protein